MKLPAIQFYPGDWKKDLGVQSLDWEARAVWFEMLLLMHDSAERGKLILNGRPMTDSEIAQAIGMEPSRFKQNASKIQANGVANYEQNTWICRRMIRDENTRRIRKYAGSLGGSKRVANLKQKSTPSSSVSSSSSVTTTKKDIYRSAPKSHKFIKPTAKEVTVYGLSIDYKIDGEKFINHYEARDWKAKGSKITNWKAAVRTWKSNAEPHELIKPKSIAPSHLAKDQARREEEDAITRAEHEAHDRAMQRIGALPRPEYDAIYAEAVKRLPQGHMAEKMKGSLLPTLMVEVWREKALVKT